MLSGSSKEKITIGIWFVAGLLIALYVLAYYQFTMHPLIVAANQTPLSSAQINVGSTKVQVTIANTDASRTQGLSGSAPLAPNTGMLFVFDSPNTYGFWMKDMNYALDILFINAQGKIVTVDQNLLPQSYLQKPPQIFYPTEPILLALEVPAGFSAEHNVKVGTMVTMDATSTSK